MHSTYEIDLFKVLIAASEAATGVPAKGEHQASHRVIADHLRATSFLIAEGVLPSNVGRGYVLRRIMRRAMRHAHLLGAKDPLMYRLVPALVQQMGETYQELVHAQPLITETLKLEETRFRKTLEKGLGLLDEASGSLKKGDVFSGDTAFRLYDTYGFPLDLTQDALKSRGITVDTAAFDAAMQKQKEKARQSWTGSGEAATESVWFEVQGARRGHRVPWAMTREVPKASMCAIVKDGKEVEAAARQARGARWCEPNPILWRVGRPGRRHWAYDRREHERRRYPVFQVRHSEEGGRFDRPLWSGGRRARCSQATTSSSS